MVFQFGKFCGIKTRWLSSTKEARLLLTDGAWSEPWVVPYRLIYLRYQPEAAGGPKILVVSLTYQAADCVWIT